MQAKCLPILDKKDLREKFEFPQECHALGVTVVMVAVMFLPCQVKPGISVSSSHA